MAGFPHIAVVDDEEPIVEILSYSLKKKFPDAVISGFSRADEAWEWLATHRVDILLTDLNMPEVDGKEIVSMMQHTAQGTPVIVISGAVPLTEMQDLEAEFPNVSVFAKPLLTRELIEGIENSIGKRYNLMDGSLDGLSLMNILQILHIQKKTVQVEVQHPSGTGGVVLKNGEPILIEFGESVSEKAFLQLLALKRPKVTIEPTQYSDAGQSSHSFAQLVSMYARSGQKKVLKF